MPTGRNSRILAASLPHPCVNSPARLARAGGQRRAQPATTPQAHLRIPRALPPTLPSRQDVGGGPPAGASVALVVPVKGKRGKRNAQRNAAKVALQLAGLLPENLKASATKLMADVRPKRGRPQFGCLCSPRARWAPCFAIRIH
jgi:hypothetical protein